MLISVSKKSAFHIWGIHFPALNTSFKECGDHMKTYRNFCEPKLSICFFFLILWEGLPEMSCGVPETVQRDFKGSH